MGYELSMNLRIIVTRVDVGVISRQVLGEGASRHDSGEKSS